MEKEFISEPNILLLGNTLRCIAIGQSGSGKSTLGNFGLDFYSHLMQRGIDVKKKYLTNPLLLYCFGSIPTIEFV